MRLGADPDSTDRAGPGPLEKTGRRARAGVAGSRPDPSFIFDPAARGPRSACWSFFFFGAKTRLGSPRAGALAPKPPRRPRPRHRRERGAGPRLAFKSQPCPVLSASSTASLAPKPQRAATWPTDPSVGGGRAAALRPCCHVALETNGSLVLAS
jgi:hypothetical protein